MTEQIPDKDFTKQLSKEDFMDAMRETIHIHDEENQVGPSTGNKSESKTTTAVAVTGLTAVVALVFLHAWWTKCENERQNVPPPVPVTSQQGENARTPVITPVAKQQTGEKGTLHKEGTK